MKIGLMDRKLEVSPSVVLLPLKDVMWVSCRDWIGDVERGTFVCGIGVEKALLQ